METTNVLAFLHSEHEINSDETVAVYRKKMEDTEKIKHREVARMEQLMHD